MWPTWQNRSHTLLSRLAGGILHRLGWTLILEPPPSQRFVGVAAPHTSNYDFWMGMLFKWASLTPMHFVAKHELFRFPMGIFFRAVGGIPLNRRRKGGRFVDAVVEVIQDTPEIMLVVAPEGTRTHTESWKTGFYYMALQAKVPLGIAILDWRQKRLGIVGYVMPTGDIEADFKQIRRFYEGVQGYNPRAQGPIVLKKVDE